MLDRLKEYQSAQNPTKIANTVSMAQMPTSDSIHWKPPRSTYCKVNFDSAIFQDLQMAGIGVVIRDSSGQVIGALLDKIHIPSIVDDVEAIACRRAISFAMEIGVEEVVVEGDSKTIIKALNSDSSCLSSFGHVVEDIGALVLNFASCVFSHVKRQGNAVADKWAKLAKYSPCPSYWSDGIPCDVQNLVVTDRSFC